MKKNRWRRLRVTADPKLQLSFTFRIALYWLGCLATVAVLYGTRLAVREFPMTVEETCSQTWQQIGPALLASVFFLPLILVDALIASNKFAGPMLQIRRSLATLADGQRLPNKVVFRNGDYYLETAEHLNQLNRQLLRQNKAQPESVESENANTPVTILEANEGSREVAIAAS